MDQAHIGLELSLAVLETVATCEQPAPTRARLESGSPTYGRRLYLQQPARRPVSPTGASSYRESSLSVDDNAAPNPTSRSCLLYLPASGAP